MGFGGDSAFGQQIGSKLNRIEELGLEGYVNELTQTISSLDKAANEPQVSDAFKYVMQQGAQSDNVIEGLSDVGGAFWNDLNFSQI